MATSSTTAPLRITADIGSPRTTATSPRQSPPRPTSTFNVRTYNGEFVTNLNLAGPPRSEARRGRRLSYTLGNGSAEMEMETFGGSIRIQRSGSTSTGSKDKED